MLNNMLTDVVVPKVTDLIPTPVYIIAGVVVAAAAAVIIRAVIKKSKGKKDE